MAPVVAFAFLIYLGGTDVWEPLDKVLTVCQACAQSARNLMRCYSSSSALDHLTFRKGHEKACDFGPELCHRLHIAW